MEAMLVQWGLPEKIAGDALFAIIVIVIGITAGVTMGRYRLLELLLATYISIAIMSVIPSYMLTFSLYAELIIFVFLIAFFAVLGEYFFDISLSGSSGSIWKMAIIGMLEVGLIFSILIGYIPGNLLLQYISAGVYNFFTLPWAQLFWMTMPLLFLFIFGKKK